MGKFRERIPCKHAGGVIANGAQLHGVCGGPKESELLLRPERVIPGVQSSLFHFLSAVWAFHQNTHPFRKQKRLASFSRDKAFANTLRYHSSCRKGIPSQPLKCCPVTEASEGAYLSSAPLLQGDLSRLLPSALHQTAALCASQRRVLVLFCAL